jgi:hypothetical protein
LETLGWGEGLQSMHIAHRDGAGGNSYQQSRTTFFQTHALCMSEVTSFTLTKTLEQGFR